MSGGIIFCADLQVDYENLDLCRQVVQQMLDFGEEKRARAIVFLGDVKERLNPIDGRCLNFVMRMIARFRKAGIEVHILLGNHDRFGLHSDEESWLTSLGKAGANVYAKETAVVVGHFDLYFLPFRSFGACLQQMAESLYNVVRHSDNRHNGSVSILCFHAQLKECGLPSEGPGTISVDDLHPEAYDYVLGGHIHKAGKVKYDNVRYVGSPFAASWGEVNQRKGFVYVEV